jgi:F-type H+-transporting ATPase subunit b
MGRLTPTLVVLVCFAIDLPAFAEGGGDEEGPMKFVWEIVNFLLLVGVLVYFVRKPALQFFANRREEIGGELESAARVLEEAEGRFGEWQQKMAEVDGEFASIRDRERQRAQQERNRILADAERTAERIKADAANAVERELRRAQAQLRDEASELAIELAADILREKVAEADRDRLMDEFISRIEQTSVAVGSGS